MSLFWLVFSLFVIIFSYLGDVTKTKNHKIAKCSKFLLLITLSVVLAVCGSPFSDHEGYVDYFNYIEKLDIEAKNIFEFIIFKSPGMVSNTENGFNIFTKLLYRSHLTNIGYFFVIGSITNYFIIKVFYHFKYPTIAFLIYITSVHFSQEFNLVRQMMAVAIVLYGLSYVEKKKWKLYLGIIFLAFLIHQSAVLGLLFLPLCFVKDISIIWNKLRYPILVLYIGSLLVALRIFQVDLSLIVIGLDFYEGYLTNEFAAGVEGIRVNWLYNFLVIICILLYKGESGKNIYGLCFILGGIMNNMSVPAPNLARVAYYFTITYSTFAPDMLGSRLLFKKKIISNIALSALASYHGLVVVKFILVGNNIIGTKMESIMDFFR